MRRISIIRAALFLCLPMAGAYGIVQEVTWNGGAGAWFTSSNWTPAVVPDNGGGTTYRVFIDGGLDGTASDVDLDASAAIDRITLDAGDRLTISRYSSLTILENAAVGGTATLDGALTVSPLEGFEPQVGDAVRIVNVSSVSGSFATENLPAIGGGARTFEVVYEEASVVLNVVPLTGQSYDEWKTENFTPEELEDPEISGPDADPEGDGISNAMEYGFGSDPWIRELAPVRMGTVADAGVTFVTLTYPASTTAADAVFGVRSSANRSAWTVETTEEIERIPTGGVDEVTLKVLTPADEWTLRFYQLTLELQ